MTIVCLEKGRQEQWETPKNVDFSVTVRRFGHSGSLFSLKEHWKHAWRQSDPPDSESSHSAIWSRQGIQPFFVFVFLILISDPIVLTILLSI